MEVEVSRSPEPRGWCVPWVRFEMCQGGTSRYLLRQGNGMGSHEHWSDLAACKGVGPDELFVRGAAQNRAKQICTSCPVRTECLAEALDNAIEWGVWGGMTE